MSRINPKYLLVMLLASATAVNTAVAAPVSYQFQQQAQGVSPLAISSAPPTIAPGASGVVAAGNDVSFENGTGIAQSGFALTTGKWYFEFNNISYGGPYEPVFGIAPLSLPADMQIIGYPSAAMGVGWYPSGTNGNGCIWTHCQFSSTLKWAELTGVGVAVDLDAKTIRWFAKPSGGACIAVGTTTGVTTPTPWVPAISAPSANISATVRFNTGQQPFGCTIPAGYAPVNLSR